MGVPLTGINGLAYLGVTPLNPPASYVYPVRPTPRNWQGFNPGDFWLHKPSQDLYYLGSVALKVANWILVGKGPAANTYHTDNGDAVPIGGILDVFGGNPLNVGRNIQTQGETNNVWITTTNAMVLGDLAPITTGNAALNLITGSLFFSGDDANGQGIRFARPRLSVGIDSGTTRVISVTSTTNNTLIGANISNTAISNDNSAFGAFSLMSIGLNSNQNTAVGSGSGRLITSSNNTMVGYNSLALLVSGVENTSIGNSSGTSLVSGSHNTFLGSQSGIAFTGAESSNICINNPGVVATNNQMRIGNGTGSGINQLDHVFISGIRGIATDDPDTLPVLIDINGQLGTAVSSIKYKENIQDIGSRSSKIYDLRPVEFNYKHHTPAKKTIGLIAEEVEKSIPEMVVYKDGEPETVKYQDLPILLLNEIKRLNKRVEELEQIFKLQ